jgi:soluble lytic murein transglycosylase-like protein
MSDRLLWYAGLYAFLDGQHQNAIEKWQRLLVKTTDNDFRAGSYFWLARANLALKNESKAMENARLLSRKFPLSYYNVVAAREAGLPNVSPWSVGFGSYDDLVNALNERDFREEVWRRADNGLQQQIMRAEILLRSGTAEWSKLAVLALDAPFKERFTYKDDPEAFIYLSRLHYLAENYFQTITHTAALNKAVEDFWDRWPEQVLVAYPRPFADIYARRSLDTNLNINLLYSVSRQESAFNQNALSGAGAYGLMQLIPPTAERFAEDAGFETTGLKAKLFEPEVTIGIGSCYLRFLELHYKGFLPGILAAYNAGEYAVDSWIERRKQSDPMAWIELIPFGETKDYVKSVWRNQEVYGYIQRDVHAAYFEQMRGSERVRMGDHRFR